VSLWQRATAPLRRLRWAAARWSTDRDRTFHDQLFTARYDPFSFSYPGYLTIRRFADLAEERLAGARTVLDLGCGPGEITCELARRMPATQFTGIDHSCVAIARAKEHAQHLQLTNAEFASADLETYVPAARADAIVLFDAFHHLLDPAGFISRLRPLTGRFVLIEPAGSWTGSWNRDFDLDWIALSIFRMRDRLEQQLGIEPSAAPPSTDMPPANTGGGEPTERRYAADDFVKLFAPWPVEMTGTIAGLQDYGPRPLSSSPVRARIGETIYRLVVDIEKLLKESDADLRAKHWVIHAAPGLAARHTIPASIATEPPAGLPVQGAYDAAYANYDGPITGAAGQVFSAAIEIANRGWQTWPNTGDAPVHLTCRWLDPRTHSNVGEGLRNPLPAPMAPGSSRVIPMRIQCPDKAGKYMLSIELVHEGVTWFSDAGVAPMRMRFTVQRSLRLPDS